MTITQTLAGLWLDFGKKDEEKTRSVTVLLEKDGPRLQWLLNWFLFVNVLHLVAIWGLGYLNERRQNARKEPPVRDEGEGEDEGRWGASGSASEIDEHSVSQDLSSSDRTPASDHTTSPLLHHSSSVYQSYGTHLRSRRAQPDTALVGATTPAEVRRGKLFASLCAATVVFAWGLFLITSFIKIRSRHKREGHL